MLPQLVGQRLLVYGNSIDRHLNPAFGSGDHPESAQFVANPPQTPYFPYYGWQFSDRSLIALDLMCSRRELYRPVQPRRPAFELINFSFARFGLHSTRLGNLQDPSASMGRNRRQQLIWRRITGQFDKLASYSQPEQARSSKTSWRI